MGAHAVDPEALGDFQTPVDLAREIWKVIDLQAVEVLLEPTVGLGAFLEAAPERAHHLPWRAYDIDGSYVAATQSLAKQGGFQADVEQQDAFALEQTDLNRYVAGKSVLAIGNPPWVTNAAQAGVRNPNLPRKWNRSALTGLDAVTGKANFDIAEAVLLAVLASLQTAHEVRLAFIVKRSVAIKMCRDFVGRPGVLEARLTRIDARKWFGVSVEAVLFQLHVQPRAQVSTATVLLADALGKSPIPSAGVIDGAFVGDVDAYKLGERFRASGTDGFVWRQGIKHDLARVLELQPHQTGLVNGLGDPVDIEQEVLCPLFKSSDLASARPPSRQFPLYQMDLSGPSKDLARKWPKLANYLERHREQFDARRSTIYCGKPPFMLFGIGEYSLAPFKVAISGFYKESRFVVLRPSPSGRPPLVDDTCYMVPFDSESAAVAIAQYLNGSDVQKLLASMVDLTAKRPYTKDILGRLADPRIARELSLA